LTGARNVGRKLHKQPILIPIPEENLYEFAEPYDFQFLAGKEKRLVQITIPAGFRYDGASIPPLAWQLTYTPFHPKMMLPAGVHDYFYRMPIIDRATADSLLYSMLLDNGVSKEKAEIMYRAVRFGGRGSWQKRKDL
jgi:hypothetical protein